MQRLFTKDRVVSALAFIALFVAVWALYRGHLFDGNLIPGARDFRAHIARFEDIKYSLLTGTWPSWSPSLYLGYPPFQYYPPLFSVLGGALSLFMPTMASYKLLTLFNFMALAATLGLVGRRVLAIPSAVGYWVGVVCALSYPLVSLHATGTEPNILGWAIALLAWGYYIVPAARGGAWVVAGWLVLTILTHPFPIIFLAFFTLALTATKLLQHPADWRALLVWPLRAWLPALAVTVWWWLPAALTWQYAAPLADPVYFDAAGLGTLLVLVGLAAWVLFTQWKTFSLREPLFVAAVVAIGLAVGGSTVVPVVGQFIHNVRFVNLSVVSFAALIIAAGIYHGQREQRWLLPATGAIVLSLTFASFVAGDLRLWGRSLTVPAHSAEQAAIAHQLAHKRVVIPFDGGLVSSDSLVMSALPYSFESVTGPYSQGDPKFFDFTVHLEWEERWLTNSQTFTNLMGASAADYLLLRPRVPVASVVPPVVSNTYGVLIQSPAAPQRASSTAPALLDVPPDEVALATDLVNLLLPEGYQLPLVDVRQVAPADRALFPVVVTTADRQANYDGATVRLVIDGEAPPTGTAGTYVLPIKLSDVQPFFYQGSRENFNGWYDFDANARRTGSVAALMEKLAPAVVPWSMFTAEQVRSAAQVVTVSNRSIAGHVPSGSFTVVRTSWFPNWYPNDGTKLWRTTQGFMLVYSGTPDFLLTYRSNTALVLAKLGNIMSSLW